MEGLREALAKARAAYGAIEGELSADRKKRALDAEYAQSPRPDGDRLRQERGEALVRAEVELLRGADEILGEVRARADEWIAQRADDARTAAEEAAEAERVAAQLRAKANGIEGEIRWVQGQKRVVQDGRPQVGILRWSIAQMPPPEDPPILWSGR